MKKALPLLMHFKRYFTNPVVNLKNMGRKTITRQLQGNDKEIYLIKNEEKSVAAGRFVRNLQIYDCNVKKCVY